MADHDEEDLFADLLVFLHHTSGLLLESLADNFLVSATRTKMPPLLRPPPFQLRLPNQTLHQPHRPTQ